MGLTVGSTSFQSTVTDNPRHLQSLGKEGPYISSSHGAAIFNGFHILHVEVVTRITSLPPQYREYFKSPRDTITAVGLTLLHGIKDQSISLRLRKIAASAAFQAASLYSANISNANITVLTASYLLDSKVSSVNAMERIKATMIIAIVLGCLVGTLALVVFASAYFRIVENREKERNHIYKITSKDSTDDLLEAANRSNSILHSPGSSSSPSNSPITSPIRNSSQRTIHNKALTPESPGNGSNGPPLPRGVVTSSGSVKGKKTVGIIRSPSNREIVHVPAEVLDDGEIILFYDEQKTNKNNKSGSDKP